EDGIRDLYVTGVQTCALPILAEIGVVMLINALSGSVLWTPSTMYRFPDHGRPLTTACVGVTAPAADGFSAKSLQPEAAAPGVSEIGRASCRERGEIAVVAVSW